MKKKFIENTYLRLATSDYQVEQISLSTRQLVYSKKTHPSVSRQMGLLLFQKLTLICLQRY